MDRDCDFLEQERIMDYSLLVGLHFRETNQNTREALISEGRTSGVRTPTGLRTPTGIRTPTGLTLYFPPAFPLHYFKLNYMRQFMYDLFFSCRKWRPWWWSSSSPFKGRHGSASFWPWPVNKTSEHFIIFCKHLEILKYRHHFRQQSVYACIPYFILNHG